MPRNALRAGPSGSPPTPPAAAAASGVAALLSAHPSTELLPCGLFEDELDELDELVQSHSPKVGAARSTVHRELLAVRELWAAGASSCLQKRWRYSLAFSIRPAETTNNRRPLLYPPLQNASPTVATQLN